MCRDHAEFERADYDCSGKQEALGSRIFDENAMLFCYVITIGDQIIGYFSFTFDYSTWEAKKYLHLDCLYLEPSYRGLRIGDKVFHELVKIAKQNECANIQWQTPVFNEMAIKFYRRIGGRGKEKVRFYLGV
jgi:ribosomal protein S18 acetylase RimI-like enzyme